ncbi:hypothetical protein E2C01_015718 [Portunus trituberculatus]|uniref:Uncharacterized protein n=1 Tax=Portunus trituberculatus TaxID=210409 RepID=A0A5B7DMN3_PORTR|nr:hypothetical protein [Portunus trituberculatus]
MARRRRRGRRREGRQGDLLIRYLPLLTFPDFRSLPAAHDSRVKASRTPSSPSARLAFSCRHPLSVKVSIMLLHVYTALL